MAKTPLELLPKQRKYKNPFEGLEHNTDVDDAMYWAFQDVLDYNEDDDIDLDVLTDYINDRHNYYTSEFPEGDYDSKANFLHNALNRWNDTNKMYPNPRRTDIQVWKDRVRGLKQKHGDNAYFNNLALFADDTNGVDHSNEIQELIDTFGFDRKGEW